MNDKRLIIEEKNDNRFLISIGYCDGEYICLKDELTTYVSNYFSLQNDGQTIDKTPIK